MYPVSLPGVRDGRRELHDFELEPEVRDWLDSLSDSDFRSSARATTENPRPRPTKGRCDDWLPHPLGTPGGSQGRWP